MRCRARIRPVSFSQRARSRDRHRAPEPSGDRIRYSRIGSVCGMATRECSGGVGSSAPQIGHRPGMPAPRRTRLLFRALFRIARLFDLAGRATLLFRRRHSSIAPTSSRMFAIGMGRFRDRRSSGLLRLDAVGTRDLSGIPETDGSRAAGRVRFRSRLAGAPAGRP